jgi:hypothetical protein
MNKPHTGFVSLTSITKGAPDPVAALAEIRRIYFKTTRETIANDFAHAIELLKSLPDEASRAKAHVFMEGLAEMRRDWEGESGRSGQGGRGKRGSGSGKRGPGGSVKAGRGKGESGQAKPPIRSAKAKKTRPSKRPPRE